MDKKIIQKNTHKQYKALNFLSMLYITIALIANLLIYKLTHVGNIVISVGTFIIPFWYILGDIIAEVYGYQTARRLIWHALICTFIFTVVCNFFIHLPNPSALKSHQPEFDYVFGNLIRVFFGMLLAVLVGSFLNAYILTKWKVLVLGKLYWLRSVSSSAIGQLCFTCISISFDLFHVVPLHVLIELIAVSYTIKLIVTPIAVTPATLIAFYLKRLEGIDIYDTYTDFNPFRLQVCNNAEENLFAAK